MLIRSNILRSPHAFSTRLGGVSTSSHTSSLNLAFGRGDDDSVVLENLELFAENAGFDAKSVVSLPQIHSDRIFTVTNEDRGRGYYIRENIDKGDGYITRDRGVVLGIKTADCTPILFEAEQDGEIIAVGAVHAGWRGTAADISGKCVERLCSEFGAKKDDIRAVIGPCIHSCCYEVSEDLYSEMEKSLGQEMALKYILPSQERKGKYQCDLVSLNRALLLKHGIKSDNLDIIDECTCCHPEKFFSHRYSGGNRGTLLNIIFIKEDKK